MDGLIRRSVGAVSGDTGVVRGVTFPTPVCRGFSRRSPVRLMFRGQARRRLRAKVLEIPWVGEIPMSGGTCLQAPSHGVSQPVELPKSSYAVRRVPQTAAAPTPRPPGSLQTQTAKADKACSTVTDSRCLSVVAKAPCRRCSISRRVFSDGRHTNACACLRFARRKYNGRISNPSVFIRRKSLSTLANLR